MTIKHYPLLLIIQDDIEYIENQSMLDASLYSIDKKEFNEIFVIYNNGESHALSSPAPIKICLTELTKLVQQSLVDDGQCCVEKIEITDVCQAFYLLQGSA